MLIVSRWNVYTVPIYLITSWLTLFWMYGLDVCECGIWTNLFVFLRQQCLLLLVMVGGTCVYILIIGIFCINKDYFLRFLGLFHYLKSVTIPRWLVLLAVFLSAFSSWRQNYVFFMFFQGAVSFKLLRMIMEAPGPVFGPLLASFYYFYRWLMDLKS